jgi:hypothetical protein
MLGLVNKSVHKRKLMREVQVNIAIRWFTDFVLIQIDLAQYTAYGKNRVQGDWPACCL